MELKVRGKRGGGEVKKVMAKFGNTLAGYLPYKDVPIGPYTTMQATMNGLGALSYPQQPAYDPTGANVTQMNAWTQTVMNAALAYVAGINSIIKAKGYSFQLKPESFGGGFYATLPDFVATGNGKTATVSMSMLTTMEQGAIADVVIRELTAATSYIPSSWSQQTQQTFSSTTSAQTGTHPLSVSISGVMRSGGSWTVNVQGQPNSPVLITNFKNGIQQGNQFQQGMTDSNGHYSFSGTFSDGDVGSWMERYSVGGGSFTLTFDVGAKGAPTLNTNTTTAGTTQGQTGTAVMGVNQTVGTTALEVGNVAAGVSGGVTSFLTSTIPIAGYQIPMWMILAAGGVGAYLLFSKKGRF